MNGEPERIRALLAELNLDVPEDLMQGLIAAYRNIDRWSGVIRAQTPPASSEPATNVDVTYAGYKFGK